jgi:hypothetical protein
VAGVDDILVEMQEAAGLDIHSGFGDKKIKVHHFRCIRTQSTALDQTDRQIAEGTNMSKIRVAIEWDYAAQKAQFQATINLDGKDSESPMHQELLMCGLIKNIYNCYNGSTCSTGFCTFAPPPPPTIDQYLCPVPEPIPHPKHWKNISTLLAIPYISIK